MSDLCELGLSSYEDKVYRALLALGPATAEEVSDSSGVPMGRIYDVLNGLVARNIVRTRDGTPRKYAPVPPEVAADRLLAERERELAAERNRYEELAESVGTALASSTPSEGRFFTAGLDSKDATRLMREQFETAEDSLRSAVSVPYENVPLSAYRAELELYAELVDSSITTKLLVSEAAVSGDGPEAVSLLPTAGQGFEVRVLDGLTTTFDVVDGEMVYWSVPEPFERTRRLGGLVVEDECLASRLVERFDCAWAAGRPLSELQF